uniref:Protein encore (inferred by orthology to a D. melanogaster protein) n=1 Tax=Strongyloides venezuelensis TaxID=75913 RepID=A0A0K0FG59_STRVS
MNISSKETPASEHPNNHQKQPLTNFKRNKNTNQHLRGGSLTNRTESCTSSTNNTDGGRSSSFSHYFSNDSIVSTDQNKKSIRKFLISTLHKNIKDRKILLETEEKLSNFINSDDRTLKFDPMTSYDRMLIHRTASFFNLDHNVDQTGKCVVITKNEKSRCPDESFNSMIKSDHFSDTRNRYRSRRGASNASFYYSGNISDYSYPNSISSPVDFEYNNQVPQQYDNRTFNGSGYKGRHSGQGFYHDSGMSDLTNGTVSPRYESPLECYGNSQSPLPVAGNYNVGIQTPSEHNQVAEEVGKISDDLSQRLEINSENNEGTIISPTPPPQSVPSFYYHHPQQQPYNGNFFPAYQFDSTIPYQQPPWNPYQQQFVSQQFIPGRVVYYQPFYPSPPQPPPHLQENCIYPIGPSSSPGIIYQQQIGPYNSYYPQQTVFENEEHAEEPSSMVSNYNNEDRNIETQDYSTSSKEEDTNKTET